MSALTTTIAELRDLLRNDLARRIPDATPAEFEIIELLATNAAHVAPMKKRPVTALNAGHWAKAADILTRGLCLLGTHRVAGSGVEQYAREAVRVTNVALATERPAGRA